MDKIVNTGEGCIPDGPIVTDKSAAAMSAILAPCTISVEVMEERGGTTGLETLVRASDPLPKKGTVTFRSGETLHAGGPGTLNLKFWKGDIAKPVEDNISIGIFRVSGSDFGEGTISIGSEIRCEYAIMNDGLIQLHVSVPDIGDSVVNGEIYYAGEGASFDHVVTATLLAAKAQSSMLRLNELSKYINDPRLEVIRGRIEKASSLDVDRADQEETRHAFDEIDAARRTISVIHKGNLAAIRQHDLDIIVMSFDEWAREFAVSEEATDFHALARIAQSSIDANGSEFESHLHQLRSTSSAILSRSEDFTFERFQWYLRHPEQFSGQPSYDGLIQQGSEAQNQSDIALLRTVLTLLDGLRCTHLDPDEMLAATNIMRG